MGLRSGRERVRACAEFHGRVRFRAKTRRRRPDSVRANPTMETHRLVTAIFALTAALFPILATAQVKPTAVFNAWQHSGAITILTTPEGAALPAGGGGGGVSFAGAAQRGLV